MQYTLTGKTRKRKAFSSVRLQDPQLWERTAWLQSYYTEDKNSFVPVQEYCDAFVKHQGLNVGYRDLWNILKLAFPKVEKIRRGRKYVYWGIRRVVERTPKKSKKQAKGRSSAMNEEQTKGNVLASKTEQAADAGQCGTEQRDISVEGLDEEPPLEDNVNFIVHLGTSRVEVETTSRESPSSSETSPANPADTVVVTLPGNQSDHCQDNDSGTSGEYNSVGVERSNACALAVSHTSVQTPFTHGENEPASSLAESDACAEDTGSYKSVETQWSAEDIPRSSVARCPLGVCVGVRVKKEPMWETTEERSPCLSAEATSASYNAIEDSASSAVVPFPANDPPSASSIERLRECINRIPKVSQISEYAVLPDVHPYNQTQRSSAVNVATAPKTAQPGRVHVISNGQGPSPRPVQVSVGTQHKLCSEAVEFLPGNMRKVDEQNQDCHSILSSGASKRQKTVAASSASPEIHADRDGGKNEPLSEGSGEQSYSGALALTSMDVSVATSSQEAPTSQTTSPQTSVASGQSLLPMIVSVMSYGIPETSTPSTAHAQGNRVPSPTGQVTSAKRLKVRERSVSNESLLRSEIQFLRDELLEERRLRRAVEMQLSKCMLQLNRQKTVSQQLAEALKPFIFKS